MWSLTTLQSLRVLSVSFVNVVRFVRSPYWWHVLRKEFQWGWKLNNSPGELVQSRTSPLHARFRFANCSVPLNIFISQHLYSLFFPPTKWYCLCGPLSSHGVLVRCCRFPFPLQGHVTLLWSHYSQNIVEENLTSKLSTSHLRHSSRFKVGSQCDN